MNLHQHCPKQWQFEFLSKTISKRKRYSKWAKRDQADDILQTICNVYGVSIQKAAMYNEILTDDQKKTLVEQLMTGGRQNN
jgi:hypothetical protein